jgi:hypothetical protein
MLYRSESRRILATPHPPHSEILTWPTTRSTVRSEFPFGGVARDGFHQW